MKKFLKFIGVLLLVLILCIGGYYFANNEALPEGKTGEAADALATKMLTAVNNEAFENTELLEWSFRGKHHYKWYKQQGIVEVAWENNKVILHTQATEQSEVFVNGEKTENPEILKKATAYFNNDSFWLIAPHKVFDEGVTRSLVNYNGKDALLVSYASGGTTPGDSYLWIVDENGMPTEYKMWVQIIPIGGVSGTWNNWKMTKAGLQLPTEHTLSLFGMKIDMGDVKASNPKADALSNKILNAIKHEAYKNTNNLEWSFGGRRTYKWNKKEHIAEVVWDTTKVILHPDHLEKSQVFFNDKLASGDQTKTIKKAEGLFNNDSFWLVAPHKLFDDGALRTVKEIDGKEALLVKYTSGGTTPGDSYLWELDDNYVPKSYKMYVPSMNMEGVAATWEDWITTESGTLLPTNHTFGKNRQLSMGEVKAY